jgi:hypothetical protein
MTIHAYTEPHGPNPGYINISERVANPGDVIVTVRSAGENNASTIILSRDQLRDLVADASKHLGDDNVTAFAANLETVTFEQFVQYGRDNGANIIDGMPWSFKFRGHPVTHENDRCYLIMGANGKDIRLTPDELLVVNPDHSLATIKADPVRL